MTYQELGSSARRPKESRQDRGFVDYEQGLRELHLAKQKMLEEIIADKTIRIEELENELLREQNDNQKLEQGLQDKQSLLESYEKRFLGIRSLIERQDSELKESYQRIN